MEINKDVEFKKKRDYALVKKALNDGDQSAYASLMNNYRDSLYFAMLKMTRNAIDAEDLTLEAFGKAFKNLERYTPEYAFSTWLFKIATNNCIDYLRKKKQYNNHQNTELDKDSSLSENFAYDAKNPEQDLINEQKIKLMRNLIKTLKPRYRNIVELRYLQELSYEEISEILDLPIGTVKVQLFRARDFLFNILKNSKEKI